MKILLLLVTATIMVLGVIACEETETSDETYQKQVELVMESFIAHRHDYNVGLEQMGEEVRSATNETEYRQALEKALAHLESAVLWFGQDRT
ncbi:MAG: hypothetical protein GY861_19345, partial [bacterium]|nr:hypothetical protein [bacterium]